MAPEQLTEAIAKGSDLGEYLDHIAWKGIIDPWLQKQKTQYQSWLVDVVLSHKPIEMDNGQLLTAERCAAYVEAIDALYRMFNIVNKRRASALEQLQDADLFHLEDIDNG